MQSSHSSSSAIDSRSELHAEETSESGHMTKPEDDGSGKNTGRAWTEFLTWLCRLAAGATFIFSGVVKGIDPWGTFYKFSEYLDALGLHLVPNLVLAGVFGLCALEFLIGIFLVTGSYRKSAPVMGLLFMAVMLPLTLWIAVKDPVADCGCFGDALIISNWATFWKNVVLTAMFVWLIKFNRYSRALITPAIQWIEVVVSIIYVGVIVSYGYFVQPLIDFRPYPVGSELVDRNSSDDPEFVFVYSKDGVLKEFGEEDELPDEEDGWVFVERKEANNREGEGHNPEKTFRIWDETGEHDMTDTDISETGQQLLLLIPDLASVSPATTWKINALYDLCVAKGVTMMAVEAAPYDLIKEWVDLSMPEYAIYTAEDTAIKEVARGNPSVVRLENGKIKWKTTLSSIDIDIMSDDEALKRQVDRWQSGKDTFINCSCVYLIALGVLVTFSFIPDLFRLNTYKRRPRRRKGTPGKSD